MKVYILGISGMLGSRIFLEFQKKKGFDVRGCLRGNLNPFIIKYKKKINVRIDAKNIKKISSILKSFKPDYVINCIGYIKQKISTNTNDRDIFFVNSIFPHEIYKITKLINSRFIHFSTDCVFDGKKGNYKETASSNVKDIYGISKFLGEVKYSKSLTIRTSIIGHEFYSKKGLLEWFLNQSKLCYGYSRVFFSGLTTLEISNFVYFYIKKNIKIHGLIHLSSKKISKLNLLKKIAKIYNKKIVIKKDSSKKIDRSLNCSFIKKRISYKVPNWDVMIREMRSNQLV